MDAKLLKFCCSLLLMTCILTASAQTITGTEAVEYDPNGNRFIISNSTNILQQNSGSSELSIFGSGDADYGMEVIGNTLFTVSGGFSQAIKAFDLTTEEEIFSLSPSGTEFLNGMGSDPVSNRIWISDFSLGNILEIDVNDLSNPIVTIPISNVGCTPNGVTYDGDNNRLVFTCWSGGNLKAVDLSNYTVSNLVNTGLNQIDGIDHDGNGNFYISSWSPTRITKLSNEFSVEETISAPGLSSPADISYAIEIDTLAIANSGNNSITYVGFNTGVGIDELANEFNLGISPNPVTDQSALSFQLTDAERCTINLYDHSGRMVKELLSEKLPAGDHRILLAGLNLSQGIYSCQLNIGGKSNTISLVVE